MSIQDKKLKVEVSLFNAWGHVKNFQTVIKHAWNGECVMVCASQHHHQNVAIILHHPVNLLKLINVLRDSCKT